MLEAINLELSFFLVSILYGAGILFFYDMLRILRRVIRQNWFFVSIEDLLFWMFAGVFLFRMIYEKNNGIIRGFAIIGLGFGMIVYYNIISQKLVVFVSKIINKFLLFLKKTICFLFRPIRWLGRRIGWLFSFFHKKLRKIKKHYSKQLKKSGKTVKIALKKK